jgi:hypothetical protein
VWQNIYEYKYGDKGHISQYQVSNLCKFGYFNEIRNGTTLREQFPIDLVE